MHKRPVIYYLTEDVHNDKDRNELDLLRQVTRVVVVNVAGGKPSRNTMGLKQVTVQAPPLWLTWIYARWTRLCLLFSRLANSRTDLEFPSRNIYLKSSLARHTVNSLWKVKRWPWLNRILPRYDTLYFLPLDLWYATLGRMPRRQAGPYTRLVIHDALLIRLNRLAPLVASERARGAITIANVKSWDNPFYSQLATRVDGYLVWSMSMWQDIQRTHEIDKAFVHAWGARPFVNLIRAAETSGACAARPARRISIGYAAAFCDEVMGRHEVALLVDLANALASALPDAQIRFRPYPTLPASFYAPLRTCKNVQFNDIAGSAVDRYGDGRELIRFGSVEERLQYLGSCDVFLSLATSFSIEAVIAKCPTVHFYLPPEHRHALWEREIFKRIDISDHLLKYYMGFLPVVRSMDELVEWIDEAIQNPPRQERLLTQMGIPRSSTQAKQAWTGLKQQLLPWVQSDHHA